MAICIYDSPILFKTCAMSLIRMSSEPTTLSKPPITRNVLFRHEQPIRHCMLGDECYGVQFIGACSPLASN